MIASNIVTIRQVGNIGSQSAAFSSLAGARDAIRALSSEQRAQDITVWLRGGTYSLSETLVLNRQDGGVGESMVHYRAYPNETPIISSGKAVTGWHKLETAVEGIYTWLAQGISKSMNMFN